MENKIKPIPLDGGDLVKPAGFVSAAAGWCVVSFRKDAAPNLDPVVAWAIDEEGCPWPITVTGVCASYDALLAPGGSVESHTDCWESMGECLADLRARGEESLV